MVIAGLLFFIGAFLAVSLRCPKTVISQKLEGKGVFHIESIKAQSSPFSRSMVYTGILKSFEASGGSFLNLPCKVYLPFFGKHPPANTDYEIEGTLCQKEDYVFVLKPKKNRSWSALSSSLNFSQWRFDAKRKIGLFLKKEIFDPKVRTFFTAIVTGDIDERILHMEFGKVGLQHLLAISGFHFALFAVFLSFLLRICLPYRMSLILLFMGLTSYYFFLGNTPSILRAYAAISLVILGKLSSLRISGLNALGAALIIELLFDPLAVTQLSFQLTFLCTLAILLFYPQIQKALSYLLPSRSYQEAKQLHFLSIHGYLLCAFLKKAIALNFAVHLISIPVVLFLFHKFPLMSLAYNLFFPICAGLSTLLLFFALSFSWIPILGHGIFTLNTLWTSAILTLTANPPAFLDFTLRSQSISLSSLLSFLAFAFFLGIWLKERRPSLIS